MLLCDADVKASFRESFEEHVETRASTHCGVDCHNVFVNFSLRNKSFRKVRGVGLSESFALELLSSGRIKLHNTCRHNKQQFQHRLKGMHLIQSCKLPQKLR